jgi:hypothetical protein
VDCGVSCCVVLMGQINLFSLTCVFVDYAWSFRVYRSRATLVRPCQKTGEYLRWHIWIVLANQQSRRGRWHGCRRASRRLYSSIAPIGHACVYRRSAFRLEVCKTMDDAQRARSFRVRDVLAQSRMSCVIYILMAWSRVVLKMRAGMPFNRASIEMAS